MKTLCQNSKNIYKKLILAIFFIVNVTSFSQVGIGTTTPNAALDIRPSSLAAPLNSDGLLIPRINAFPTVLPTALQNSMLVYLTTTSLGNPPGFYYWNNPTTQWLPMIPNPETFWSRNASGYLFPYNSNDRVEIFNNTDASGTTGTGSLEIANSLRLDSNEIITNSNTELFIQNGNNGDLSVDNNTLFVDASTNSVGIGTVLPDAKLNIYNTEGTTRNLHIEKTTGTADAVLIENDGTGTAIRAENDNTTNTAEFYNYGNGRGLYVYKGAGTAQAARIFNAGSGIGLNVYNNSTSDGTSLQNAGTGNALLVVKGAGAGHGVRIESASDEAALSVIASQNMQYANGITASAGGYYCNLGTTTTTAGSVTINLANGINAAAEQAGVVGRANNANTSTIDKMGGLFYVGSSTGNVLPALAMVGSVINSTTYKILGYGIVSTLVKDTENNERVMVAPESPEALFQDYGIGSLINGFAKIELDPILSKNIAVDENHPMKVFIQLEGNCNGVYVTNKTATSFEVYELNNGSSNVSFSYQIIANRADEERGNRVSKYADMRFKPFSTKFVQIPQKHVEEVSLNDEELPQIETKPIKKVRQESDADRDLDNSDGKI